MALKGRRMEDYTCVQSRVAQQTFVTAIPTLHSHVSPNVSSGVRFPTIMEAAVVAVFGAKNESGKALLSHMLLLLGVSGAMNRVPARHQHYTYVTDMERQHHEC